MKFLISEDGKTAINTAFIKEIILYEQTLYGLTNSNYTPRCYQVKAVKEYEINDAGIVLKTFNFGDIDEDRNTAKAYLAELVASLNGGEA